MGTSAMGTGTWQQQPSANGCQVPVPWQMAGTWQQQPSANGCQVPVPWQGG
jgi:hypothetical protein